MKTTQDVKPAKTGKPALPIWLQEMTKPSPPDVKLFFALGAWGAFGFEDVVDLTEQELLVLTLRLAELRGIRMSTQQLASLAAQVEDQTLTKEMV
ncbi:MAG: hypothetical protein LLG20_08390 [Acidobacteriales bacterium]|nr:hypothetical protein [Terriglobales bacterium]